MPHTHKKTEHANRNSLLQVGVIIGGITLFLLIIFFVGKNAATNSVYSSYEKNSGKIQSALTATEQFYDFGTISMAEGKVTHQFKIFNKNAEAITVTKLYTSCMCTTAKLMRGERTIGPYGMPGHGFIPNINEKINSEEETRIDVTFDPAAHGPAGIGAIERVVYLEQKSAPPLTLTIKATVKP